MRTPARIVLAFALSAVLSPASYAASPEPAVDYPLERGVEIGRLWKKKLGLNADQVRRFTSLENERVARLKPLRELLSSEMVKLQAHLTESAPERDVADSLDQVLQIHRAIAERNDRFDSSLASILSPSQRARLIVWRSLGGLEGYAALRLAASARPDEEFDRE